MKPLFAAILALATCTAAAAATPPTFSTQRLSSEVKTLSSDAFEGRGPATPAEDKTIDYVVAQFKAAGAQPGGDLKDGKRTWTQAVPLLRSDIVGTPSLTLSENGKTRALTQGQQIAVRAPMDGSTSVAIANAPLVFVGYGVEAPERHWDDFKGVDLHGKIAVVLVNDPDFEAGHGDFGGKAMTYYGRWTYKYEEAARQGAIGFLVIHERAPASYGWATVKNSNTNEIFDVIRKDPREAHAPLEAWVQRDAAAGLMQAAGLDFEALKKQAQSRDFRPVELKGVTFSTDYMIDAQKVVSKNVAARLPGKTHPNEHVIYTAHWDHLGVGLPDAKGDRIYNGAVDNATGTALLVELARAFAKAPRTDRSILFLAVTAEEKGLLGSEYYADNPLYPLATTVANLNMDALSVNGPARDVTMSGQGQLTLKDDLIAVAKQHGRYFAPDPR
ncbi:MAG TPA: M28 family metallopeptidase, partial [Gemmatimonadales bacterium]|nr:M28 family metallopeptidase [Gemmatimonadales bacterium]